MDRTQAERWIDGYERAWRSNERADIEALFTEDGRYHTAPYRDPWTGHDDIVRGWTARTDGEGDWTFRSEVMAVDGDLAFIRGRTDYANGTSYENLFVVRIGEDGRASEFTEWFMDPAQDQE